MHAILCIYIIYTCIWCYVFVHTDLHSTLLFVFVWLHLIEGQFSVINLSQTVSLTHCAMISLPKHMLNIPISCMCCPPQAFLLLQRGCFYFCRCFLWDPYGLLFTRKQQDALEAGLAPKMQMEAEDLSFKSQLCRFHYWIYLVGLVYVEVFKCFRWCGGGQPLTISVASRHGPMGRFGVDDLFLGVLVVKPDPREVLFGLTGVRGWEVVGFQRLTEYLLQKHSKSKMTVTMTMRTLDTSLSTGNVLLCRSFARLIVILPLP